MKAQRGECWPGARAEGVHPPSCQGTAAKAPRTLAEALAEPGGVGGARQAQATLAAGEAQSGRRCLGRVLADRRSLVSASVRGGAHADY